MTEGETFEGEDLYNYEGAWTAIRLAWQMHQQRRIARAQEYYREAQYYAYKIPKWFTDYELDYNLEKIGNVLLRGY